MLIAAVAVPFWILFQCFPFFAAVAGGVTALLSGIHSVALAVVFLMIFMAFAIAASVFKL